VSYYTTEFPYSVHFGKCRIALLILHGKTSPETSENFKYLNKLNTKTSPDTGIIHSEVCNIRSKTADKLGKFSDNYTLIIRGKEARKSKEKYIHTVQNYDRENGCCAAACLLPTAKQSLRFSHSFSVCQCNYINIL
jgi:hypothetical protein